MAKVEAPNKEYNGVGPGGAVFEDGVATVDDDAALNYYRSAGYKVDGDVDNPVDEAPEPPDPREIGDADVIGTRLRDAAVDPRPEDFLAPVNAGEANPHGSLVVSPEIHASGPAGILPGAVFVEDIAKQEKRELEFAEARLVENVLAPEAVEAVVDLDDRGELELSDPGSAEAGRELAEKDSTPADVVDPADATSTPVAEAEEETARIAEEEGTTHQAETAAVTPPAKETAAKKSTARKRS